MSQLATKQLESNDELKYLRGAEALQLVSLTTEMILSITTALGKKIRCKSSLIGCDFKQHIYLRIPDISPNDKRYFLNEGYWVQVNTICDQGEGAKLAFKSKIVQYVDSLGLLAIELPFTVTMKTLRSESRYSTSLKGIALRHNKKVPITVTDLSMHGCGLSVNRLHCEFVVDDEIKVKVINESTRQVYTFTGEVMNLTENNMEIRAGVKLDEQGESSVKHLMSQLTYNGSVLAFTDS
ncbi:flagellar brake domain-containing protein [Thaumasiovibrio sp. DFM-14]|uniref:flagellar brake domain-containing protein n=1 Tax=Thaumasiovibrio sp. DFM-14 TaxID=3384792 RepID=UPI0039A0D08E